MGRGEWFGVGITLSFSLSGEECLAKDDVGLMRIISICAGRAKMRW